jgi:D-beta-D-heptose 7-phosphate kinase/D-beta-D-heptose 1-phosphate adenosyltransferase
VRKDAHARSRVVSRREAAARTRAAQARGERVVFTSGCFDLLHVGHVRSLEEARALGDRLVVGVNADATVRRLKGAGRPVLPARQRAELLAALACVDWVFTFGEPTPRASLAAVRPDVYAKGGDWSLAALRANDAPPRFAGEIRRLRQVPGVRSTQIVEAVRAGRSAGATRGARKKRSR